MAELHIRPARPDDARAVCAIYDYHVAHGTASFDSEGPSEGEWVAKIADIRGQGWPFLVAERDGDVQGYAYATQFRPRAAYARTCENSIYVADMARATGVGSQLLMRLIDDARSAGFEQMIAVIGGGEPASVALHGKLGFVLAGRMRNVGFKFGRRLDTVYMQRSLIEGEQYDDFNPDKLT
ncbi:N-acetyltransferase family protein [Erythrobacter sp. SDW2]|uniref:GNAT family N-acetyltransferase n=1 Tax=Erythrobacter sp. SDW2 TaxID=2907154 RepID=UPI001F1B3A67|nr:GNAT family N-acetyltransferase [Erythrobacter sp. SDW2]UIP05626.1 N-acetyltransferase family protein [Erythrobacter sp. SDW2]